MAYTAIADIITPEVLGDQISAKFPDQLVLANQTNLVDVNGEFPMGAPGTQLKIPFWKRIGGFASMTEGTPLTTGKIQASAEFAIVERAGAAFAVLDTAELVSNADPVAEIAGQVARRAAEYVDNKLTSKLLNTPNSYDGSAVDMGGTATGLIGLKGIINAMLTLGDNQAALRNGGALIMHSKVKADLDQLGVIQNQYQSGMNFVKDGMVPTILGLPIVVSDLVIPSGVSNPAPKYYTYIVGPKALGLFYQRQVMVEFDRDILTKEDIISADVHFAAHLYGYDDNSSAVVAEQNKSIHAVLLKTL